MRGERKSRIFSPCPEDGCVSLEFDVFYQDLEFLYEIFGELEEEADGVPVELNEFKI